MIEKMKFCTVHQNMSSFGIPYPTHHKKLVPLKGNSRSTAPENGSIAITNDELATRNSDVKYHMKECNHGVIMLDDSPSNDGSTKNRIVNSRPSATTNVTHTNEGLEANNPDENEHQQEESNNDENMLDNKDA